MGITNGVDYSEWDPSTDGLIAMSYDSRHLENKSYCKKDLLSSIGFTQDTSKPVIGIVTRLAWQKGIDLIAEIMGELMLAGAIVVVLGKGDEAYEKELVRLSAKYPEADVNLNSIYPRAQDRGRSDFFYAVQV
jgi:starch synthase